MSRQKNRLGIEDDFFFTEEQPPAPVETNSIVDGKEYKEIDLGLIAPDPEQPRKKFDKDGIAELALSIDKIGLQNPISLKPNGRTYTIISGERRFGAYKLLNRSSIPALILNEEKDELSLKLMQIDENIQRKDLNIFEEARAYKYVKDEFNLKIEDMTKYINKKKTHIYDMLKITDINPVVIAEIENNLENVRVGKRVLVELARYNDTHEIQSRIWGMIKDNPSIKAIDQAIEEVTQRYTPPEIEQPKEKKEYVIDREKAFSALRKSLEDQSILDIIPDRILMKIMEKYLP
jgi:ParB family chromosome partitioning protein